MEFNFLPKLPKSDLDDRKYKDLVDECILRIPRYCPEWTNYNASDPGITLIELFAWLTDQMLLRFNQVPRRNYVTFLELLGIRLQAPTPAQTELTFYLSASLPETIQKGVEVATVRTDSQEAIVFSTDSELVISNPRLRHFLSADRLEDSPLVLRDRFTGGWTLQPEGDWAGTEQPLFSEQPEEGNCFYLVFEPDDRCEGNVIAVSFKGQAGTPTGINPDIPPRRWEAWNGTEWQSVLLQERDDETKGFSFSEIERAGGNPLDGADVVLHMPLQWPVTHFTTYHGRWVRCVYSRQYNRQPGYISSPRIVGLAARPLGGTVRASQSIEISNELLGVSDGTPGQTFQLQVGSILPRREDEYIQVALPLGGSLPQRWQEVNDFADSGPNDLHYTIDSLTGTVQFGPLIREPAHLQQQTLSRMMNQSSPARGRLSAATNNGQQAREDELERQYGAVPPKGYEIHMVKYRTGGGRRGNVQAGAIRVPKSSIPYVARVINHTPARNGADAESLEDAVIRVPAMLRTRNRAVTPEDFETLALEGGGGAVARARCLAAKASEPGTVRVLLVPQANTDAIARGEGISPDLFALTPQLKETVLSYLDERRLLGVQVRYSEPEYVGVSVQTEVALEPEYNNPLAEQEILSNLRIALYRFLNPLTGGSDGSGWPFGRPVYPSDIVTLFQRTPGVRYLGVVQLFELRRRPGENWVRRLPQDPVINPGPTGLVCSWANNLLRSGHVVNLIQ